MILSDAQFYSPILKCVQENTIRMNAYGITLIYSFLLRFLPLDSRVRKATYTYGDPLNYTFPKGQHKPNYFRIESGTVLLDRR